MTGWMCPRFYERKHSLKEILKQGGDEMKQTGNKKRETGREKKMRGICLTFSVYFCRSFACDVRIINVLLSLVSFHDMLKIFGCVGCGVGFHAPCQVFSSKPVTGRLPVCAEILRVFCGDEAETFFRINAESRTAFEPPAEFSCSSSKSCMRRLS